MLTYADVCCFQAADHDKSGSLDPQEFEECIRSISLNFSEDDIKLLLAAADVNQDGQIQYGSLSLCLSVSLSLSLSYTHTHTHSLTHSLLGCRTRFVVCVVCVCVRAGSSLPWPSI